MYAGECRGYPRFIAHNELHTSETQNLKDDTRYQLK